MVKVGRQLLHYRLNDKIGEGGMGAVWRATDTTLGREVAIKVLLEGFSADADRLSRFEREAKLLATLNHPNVAAIYGLHEDEGVCFIAMELVDGEELSQRIARGPLPVAETLEIAAQIAEGLSAAHEAGVVHRDLKPANVMLTAEGKVKVLDFGIAKAHQQATASGPQTLQNSPTIASAGTMAGVILGTAAYMSPEQARGRPLDRRTDLWSFGAVLFEMLTGRKPFSGEVLSDVLAKILEREPAWDQLPANMHPGLRRLLERCLTKNPENRLRDAADVRIEIQHLLSETLGGEGGASIDEPSRPVQTSVWLRLLPWAMVAMLLAWVVVAPLIRPAAQTDRLLHFQIQPPAGYTFTDFETAPDGSAVAFVAADGDGERSLWVRRLDRPEARRLPGTEDASFPFWAPDTRSIAFFSGDKLRRITLAGESVQTIAEAPNGRGGAWHSDGTILFTPDGGDVLYTVAAAGGELLPATRLKEDEISHRFPHFVGGTRRFVFHAHSQDGSKIGRRYLGTLDSQELVPLPDGFSEVYTPPGRALYIRETSLLVQDFDPASGRLSGDAFPLVNDVNESEPVIGRSQFSVSASGVLMYIRSPLVETRIDVIDHNGRRVETLVPAGDFMTPNLSHDGNKLLFMKNVERGGSLWLLDLERASTRRLLETGIVGLNAAWSSDDHSIFYAVRNKLFRLPVAGGESELILDAGQDEQAASLASLWGIHVSADGSFLTFTGWDPVSDLDLWILRLDDGGASGPRVLAQAPGEQQQSKISPNMHWVAYSSEESGRLEVYVRSADPASEEQWLISANGGTFPRWSADGSSLFYEGVEEKALMKVAVDSSSSRFAPGLPVVAMDQPKGAVSLVGIDGERFVVQVAEEDIVQQGIEVVVGWEALVRR